MRLRRQATIAICCPILLSDLEANSHLFDDYQCDHDNHENVINDDDDNYGEDDDDNDDENSHPALVI